LLVADAVVGYYSIYCEQIKLWCLENVDHLTLWRLPAFEDFWKKTPKGKWLCVGISLLLYGLRTWSTR